MIIVFKNGSTAKVTAAKIKMVEGVMIATSGSLYGAAEDPICAVIDPAAKMAYTPIPFAPPYSDLPPR